MNHEYDIAISFAGEDRQTAAELADALKAKGLTVFYDLDYQASLWGKNLYEHLADVYGTKARFCLVLVSRHYTVKDWTRHELASAQGRAFKQSTEYILPIRLDETSLPGLPPTVGYLDGRKLSIVEIAALTVEKVGELKPTVAPAQQLPQTPNLGSRLTIKAARAPAGDLERRRFVQESFATIKNMFVDGLRDAKRTNPELEFEVEDLTACAFEAIIYLRGNRKAGARIYYGEQHMPDAILYSHATRNAPSSGFNEMLTVIETDAGLALRPTMAGFDVAPPKDVLGPIEAAEYLWLKMTRPLTGR